MRSPMPAAAATAGNVGDRISLVGGLRNRLTIGRNGRSTNAADDAHAGGHDKSEHEMTHVEFLRFAAGGLAAGL